MSKINLKNYTVKHTTDNATVHYNYIGEDKEGNPKEQSTLVGHYNPKVYTGCVQALEAIISHGNANSEEEVSLQEMIAQSKLTKEEIQSWVKEVWVG
ncbi:hypothetical protein NVP1170O_161 [Vibrio phage 1.170.O._10N.261.52.C3]|nr:hypothetical protein NVP1170O_161 [Vibrio phage 1.170.O._10N.261.52.C3]